MACLLLFIIISALSHADDPITPLESSSNIPIKTSLIMPLVTGAAQNIYQDVAEGIRSNNDLEISMSNFILPVITKRSEGRPNDLNLRPSSTD